MPNVFSRSKKQFLTKNSFLQFDYKDSCLAASTDSFAVTSYSSDDNTITIAAGTLSGEGLYNKLTSTFTLDGFSIGSDTVQGGHPSGIVRVLIKDGIDVSGPGTTDNTLNGIYEITTSQINDDDNPLVLTRASDFSSSNHIHAGARTHIERGIVNENTDWVLITDGTITLGSTELIFSSSSSKVKVTVNDNINENNLITFVENQGDTTGEHRLEMDTDLKYNPFTGTVIAPVFSGNLLGSATTSDTATNATNVKVTDNESEDEENLITFVADHEYNTGNHSLEMHSNLKYNPNTGTVSATAFAGSGASLTSLPLASGDLTGVTSIYNDELRVGYASDGMHLSFHEEGEILIYSGTESSTTNLKFLFDDDGHFHADTDMSAFSTSTGSDKRLKKNIKDINYGLKDILNLRGVEFDWKEKLNGKHDIGFIAQEVQEVIPEVINEIPNTNDVNDKYLGVDYSRIVPILVESIKEQQKQIDSLKSEVEFLKNK